MKKLLIILLFLGICSFVAHAQCAIYISVSAHDCAWGNYFDDGKPPHVSMQECENKALLGCKTHGGNNCKLLYKSFTTGWWALISGIDKDGKIFFTEVDGHDTKSEAIIDVKKRFTENGGINVELDKVETWYVPPHKD